MNTWRNTPVPHSDGEFEHGEEDVAGVAGDVGDPCCLEGEALVIHAERGDGAGEGDVVLFVARGDRGGVAEADAGVAGVVEVKTFLPGVADVGLDAGVGIRKSKEVKGMAVALGVGVITFDADAPGHFVEFVEFVLRISGADVVNVEGDDDGVVVGFPCGVETVLPRLPPGGEGGGGIAELGSGRSGRSGQSGCGIVGAEGEGEESEESEKSEEVRESFHCGEKK